MNSPIAVRRVSSDDRQQRRGGDPDRERQAENDPAADELEPVMR